MIRDLNGFININGVCSMLRDIVQNKMCRELSSAQCVPTLDNKLLCDNLPLPQGRLFSYLNFMLY